MEILLNWRRKKYDTFVCLEMSRYFKFFSSQKSEKMIKNSTIIHDETSQKTLEFFLKKNVKKNHENCP